MRFRPCIDLHSGEVKQIVGSSLTGDTSGSNEPSTNFVSSKPSSYYADLYKKVNLLGGHVIMLGSNEANVDAATAAIRAYPNALQVGGGMNDSNCLDWLGLGASKIIFTSFLFNDGTFSLPRLKNIHSMLGSSKIVLDLSCRRNPDIGSSSPYFVVMNKWQTFTDMVLTPEKFLELSDYCSEFLVHGVDVEGLRCGVLIDLIALIREARELLVSKGRGNVSIVYAGGIRDFNDVEVVRSEGGGEVDFTVGSALDIFGGDMVFDEVVERYG